LQEYQELKRNTIILDSDKMKGTELPINAIIIIVLALIVLIAILAFYFNVWNPSVDATKLEAAKRVACNKLVSMGGCDSPNIYTYNILTDGFDADKDGKLDPGDNRITNQCDSDPGNAASEDNLRTLCQCNYMVGIVGLGAETDAETECKRIVCGCP